MDIKRQVLLGLIQWNSEILVGITRQNALLATQYQASDAGLFTVLGFDLSFSGPWGPALGDWNWSISYPIPLGVSQHVTT
jgi:hypothetical protein